MSKQRVSVDGLLETVSHEAIVQFKYRDSVGVDTFGIGLTRHSGAVDLTSIPYGKEMPLSFVLTTFRQAARKYESRVAQFMKGASQTQFDAGFSFDYNTGGIGKATWVKSHNAGQFAVAAAQILNWSTPKEIIPRRTKEQILYRTGKYSNDGTASVFPADTNGRVLFKKGKRVNIRVIADQLWTANESDDQADTARNVTNTTGAGTGATGAASQIPESPTPSIPSPSDIPGFESGDLQTFLLFAAIGLGIVAAIAGIRWFLKRRNAKTLTNAAALQLTAEIPHGNPDTTHDSHITGFAPNRDE